MDKREGFTLEEVKQIVKHNLLVERLELEDINPDDIGDQLTLFGDGLGLDSIEAYEVMVGMEEVFGVMVEDIPADELKGHLRNVETISLLIQSRLSA